MVKEPLVSANMITYNHESYIAQAIKGVLQQETSFPFELVLGEDCSTDGTREIVFDYQRKYPDIIRVITSDKNVGIHKNGIRAEKACRGKYIAYCEGDDYWHHPQKLQKQVDYLESHPEYGLVHSDVDVNYVYKCKKCCSINRSMNINYDNFENEKDIFILSLNRKYKIQTSTVCVRKKLINDVVNSDPIFRHNRFLMGDLPRWLEISRITKFKYIDENLATYNVLPESASRSENLHKQNRFYLSILDVIFYFANKYNCTEKLDKAMIARYKNKILAYSYDCRDIELAKEVKKMDLALTLKQYLLYYGTVSRLMNITLLPFVKGKRFINRIRKGGGF